MFRNCVVVVSSVAFCVSGFLCRTTAGVGRRRRCMADSMQGCDVRVVSMFCVERDVIMRGCSLSRD